MVKYSGAVCGKANMNNIDFETNSSDALHAIGIHGGCFDSVLEEVLQCQLQLE